MFHFGVCNFGTKKYVLSSRTPVRNQITHLITVIMPYYGLTRSGLNKMANILQTTFSNVFCWSKTYFKPNFSEVCLYGVQLTIYRTGNGLVQERRHISLSDSYICVDQHASVCLWPWHRSVTMTVSASGHQVRCIPWVQMGIFNKKIGFLCGLKFFALNIWVRSRNRVCLVLWFCYQLIAKPGNKTAAVSWPDPYFVGNTYNRVYI